MRAALYYTPAADSPLTLAAAEWLGRNPYTGGPSRAPDVGIDPTVAAPARYGFHATIKAPFRLAAGRDLGMLANALADFASGRAAFPLPPLEVKAMPGGFLALVPAAADAALDALATDTVRHFDPFRAPMTEDERQKRLPGRLTERQRTNLDRFGYPHVLDDFHFHMTLTGPLGAESTPLLMHLKRRFAPFLRDRLTFDALALFIEPYPGAPFTVAARCPLAVRAPQPEFVP
ncbi:DUF1045 domain-containing protein [Aureimonas sp. OT7]|uniref:DUF1045 domain-containing protein n=1 Tax=Aureimonas TaxID=414371 RepID=UPI0017804FA2|nr:MULTISPECIES: DUF1045 domain-containing protein [Aureimonas]QOG05262.1 DUF1045 domain-containing protein [Aureimonas sp. OT7]